MGKKDRRCKICKAEITKTSKLGYCRACAARINRLKQYDENGKPIYKSKKE